MISTMRQILEDCTAFFEFLGSMIAALPTEIKVIFLFFFAATVIFLVIRAISDIAGGS